MYSRYHNPDGKAVQLPDNYSGCAFSAQKSSFFEPKPHEHFAPPTDARRVEIAKPTLPNTPIKEDVQEVPKEAKTTLGEACPTDVPPPPPPALGFLGSLGKHFSPASGLGFEELLLLGLIILLSQTDQSSDVVLWLALLLFCG